MSTARAFAARCIALDRALAWVLASALSWALAGVASAQETPVLSGAALVDALREGGFNVYFRHAATEWSQHDDVREDGDWTICDGARMRQLSEGGRDTARAVGEAIRALSIPVAKVLASPYCRTVETAQSMALGTVDTTTDVMNLRVADRFGGRAAIARTARALLATPPPAGANVVIVAHGNVAREATGVYPGEGEGLAFRPDGAGGFEFVGRLPPATLIEFAARRR